MPIVSIIVLLFVVGFVIYMLQTAPIPIHPWVKTLIMGLIGICLLIWVLQLFGLDTGIHHFYLR